MARRCTSGVVVIDPCCGTVLCCAVQASVGTEMVDLLSADPQEVGAVVGRSKGAFQAGGGGSRGCPAVRPAGHRLPCPRLIT